ncbi:MAG: AmmeMemoRadiSam system protein B, partial [Planctomycetes bacterium]|nr:AmmeMemoRadiSam system protein B [Planctomycetota bacterium]
VPVAFSPFEKAEQFGKQAAQLIESNFPDKKVVALASTDLTHYGAAFGIMPAGSGPEAVEWTRRNDEKFLDAAISLDADQALATALQDSNACGAGAAAAIIGWAKERGVQKGRLLAHTNSFEIAPGGPADHMVGYGAVIFEA